MPGIASLTPGWQGLCDSLPFLKSDKLIGRDSSDRLDTPVHPVNFDQVNGCSFLEAKMQAKVAGGEITATSTDFSPLHQITCHNLDLCPNGVAVWPLSLQSDVYPV